MGNQNKKGIRRLINATGYSVEGFKAAFKNEAAFRQELALTAVMIPAGFWIGTTAVERGLLVASCLMVLITELLNSAVEAVVDRVGLEHHLLSKQAKDMGSAAVLLSLVMTMTVWGLIAWERFMG
jgi:diacylglycerol kinase (ATP)